MTATTRVRDDPLLLAEGVRHGERASRARMLSLVEAGDPRFEAIVDEHTQGAFDPHRVAKLVVAAELGTGA